MAKQNIKSKQGFTIIEVVLVLAIAGLIFLMVFVALPALQRSQRDTQRRDDIARLNTALSQYQANNNNRLPATGNIASSDNSDMCNNADANSACALIKKYMNASDATENTFQDPDGQYYGVHIGEYGKGSMGYAADANGVATSAGLKENTVKGPSGADQVTGLTYEGGGMNHMIYVVTKAKCDGETIVKGSANNEYAVFYRLEGSGSYCIDNQ